MQASTLFPPQHMLLHQDSQVSPILSYQNLSKDLKDSKGSTALFLLLKESTGSLY